jgi:hypothetical protein
MSTAEKIRREGKRSGQVDLLLCLLVAKFGALPQTIEERIRSATAKDLDRWAVAVLTADNLDEVFAR